MMQKRNQSSTGLCNPVIYFCVQAVEERGELRLDYRQEMTPRVSIKNEEKGRNESNECKVWLRPYQLD